MEKLSNIEIREFRDGKKFISESELDRVLLFEMGTASTPEIRDFVADFRKRMGVVFDVPSHFGR